MKAVGDYAIVRIDNTISSTGIQIKNDGVGICVSCPINSDIETQTVLFDPNQTYQEYSKEGYNYLIMNYKFIMAVVWLCANCGEETMEYLVMTPIGQRAFCSEKCYTLYVGIPYHGEGYYGLNKYNINDVEMIEW